MKLSPGTMSSAGDPGGGMSPLAAAGQAVLAFVLRPKTWAGCQRGAGAAHLQGWPLHPSKVGSGCRAAARGEG